MLAVTDDNCGVVDTPGCNATRLGMFIITCAKQASQAVTTQRQPQVHPKSNHKYCQHLTHRHSGACRQNQAGSQAAAAPAGPRLATTLSTQSLKQNFLGATSTCRQRNKSLSTAEISLSGHAAAQQQTHRPGIFVKQ